MNNLIIGNGLIIKYGGEYYKNDQIVKNFFDLLNSSNLPNLEIFSNDKISLLNEIISKMESEVKNIINNKINLNVKKNSILYNAACDFRTRYKNTHVVSLNEIGFEDFFMITEVMVYKIANKNERKELVILLNRMLQLLFNYIIYNNGKINKIYKKFPQNIINNMNIYDNIFTTNYDRNIDIVYKKKKVIYLHGSYHKRDNRLNFSDYNLRYEYLNSDNIMNYSGFEKIRLKGNDQINNELIRTFDLNKKPKLYSIMYYFYSLIHGIKDTEFEYLQLLDIRGKVEVVGLNPNNDTHIFKDLNDNKNIEEIIFYYHTNDDYDSAKKLLNEKTKFLESKFFWEK